MVGRHLTQQAVRLDGLPSYPCDSGEWRNWQTRRIQVPVSERMWGFKSPLAHEKACGPAAGKLGPSMGLQQFERRLERLVEGVFAKAFRSGLEPVEVGRRMAREMDR